MKKYVFLFLSLTCLLSVNLRAQSIPVVYAHRGCWLGTEVPENSVYAVEMAKRYGYTTIECDVHYTKDSVMVIMHDTNDMRRCIRRKADNSKLDGALKLSDINFDDLRKYYVLASDNPQYRSPVPTSSQRPHRIVQSGPTDVWRQLDRLLQHGCHSKGSTKDIELPHSAQHGQCHRRPGYPTLESYRRENRYLEHELPDVHPRILSCHPQCRLRGAIVHLLYSARCRSDSERSLYPAKRLLLSA